MPKSLLYILMLCMPIIFSAQKIRTEINRDNFGKGNVVWVETWEKINHNTEAYKMVTYDPSSNSTRIWGITTYTLVNGKKEGRYEVLDGFGKDYLLIPTITIPTASGS